MSQDKISRKAAIKKMGKYAAITALGTYTILSPKTAQAGSPPHDGGITYENFEDNNW